MSRKQNVCFCSNTLASSSRPQGSLWSWSVCWNVPGRSSSAYFWEYVNFGGSHLTPECPRFLIIAEYGALSKVLHAESLAELRVVRLVDYDREKIERAKHSRSEHQCLVSSMLSRGDGHLWTVEPHRPYHHHHKQRHDHLFSRKGCFRITRGMNKVIAHELLPASYSIPCTVPARKTKAGGGHIKLM